MFTLSKAAGARVPDEIRLDIDKDICSLGQAVELDGTIAVSGSAVAGVCTSEYTSPGGLSGDSFSPTFPLGPDSSDAVRALVLPVTGTVLFDADCAGTTAHAVGDELDINAAGTGLAATSTNGDFRVLEILASDDDDYTTKVKGVFLNPGYFAS